MDDSRNKQEETISLFSPTRPLPSSVERIPPAYRRKMINAHVVVWFLVLHAVCTLFVTPWWYRGVLDRFGLRRPMESVLSTAFFSISAGFLFNVILSLKNLALDMQCWTTLVLCFVNPFFVAAPFVGLSYLGIKSQANVSISSGAMIRRWIWKAKLLMVVMVALPMLNLCVVMLAHLRGMLGDDVCLTEGIIANLVVLMILVVLPLILACIYYVCRAGIGEVWLLLLQEPMTMVYGTASTLVPFLILNMSYGQEWYYRFEAMGGHPDMLVMVFNFLPFLIFVAVPRCLPEKARRRLLVPRALDFAFLPAGGDLDLEEEEDAFRLDDDPPAPPPA